MATQRSRVRTAAVVVAVGPLVSQLSTELQLVPLVVLLVPLVVLLVSLVLLLVPLVLLLVSLLPLLLPLLLLLLPPVLRRSRRPPRQASPRSRPHSRPSPRRSHRCSPPPRSQPSPPSSDCEFRSCPLAYETNELLTITTASFYGVPGAPAPIVGVVGLGKPATDDAAAADAARLAAAKAVDAIRALHKNHEVTVTFDRLGHGIGTAEGANLATYSYDELKSNDSHAPLVNVKALAGAISEDDWRKGSILADAQNIARTLTETPANYMTPQIFAARAAELFKGIPNVSVIARDRSFMEKHKMGSFLSVARGSEEPPVLLEIHYNGSASSDSVPLSFVGKGVTFDSGGISLKPSADMALMKGDMGGAASVLAATWGIAKLGTPINIRTVIPLTENMPSGRATKPGDVVRAMNGKTIEVDNTDAEGRLILADAIYYAATTYKPKTVVELSTLTGAMVIALGYPFSGVFSTTDSLWQKLETAGNKAGDPFWRMPLSDKYKSQISSHVADLKNTGGRSAGSCTAAIFLKEFLPTAAPVEGSDEPGAPTVEYAHIDIAGSMDLKAPSGYLAKGMTGRPTRSLIAFAEDF